MAKFIGFSLFLFGITLAVFFLKLSHLEQGHIKMCDTLKREFLEGLSDQDHQECLSIFKYAISFKNWELKTKEWMSQWSWSHLSVYSPVEYARMWESTSVKTIGVKLKTIEGEILAYHVHPDSIFKKGDIFLSVKGDLDLTEDKILKTGGEYVVERQRERVSLAVPLGNFTWDDRMEYFKEEDLLVVPSFRGEFFTDESLKELGKRLKEDHPNKLVIDLRDNFGGNIASGLRLLSLFTCGEKDVGAFVAGSRKGQPNDFYPFEISQEVQVAHVKKFYKTVLRTKKLDYCYEGDLKVLINSFTASTSEIVAQAVKDLKLGVVVGEISSGQMVLGGWEKIENFPEGYYYSYPYALYESISGAKIEGEGVTPNLFRTYRLDLESLGKESFLTKPPEEVKGRL